LYSLKLISKFAKAILFFQEN